MKIYSLTDSEEVLKFSLYIYFIKFRSTSFQVIVSKIKLVISNFNFNNGEETFFQNIKNNKNCCIECCMNILNFPYY